MFRSKRWQALICSVPLFCGTPASLLAAPKATPPAAPLPTARPPFTQVETTVRQYFLTQKFSPLDLISSQDAEPIFGLLEQQGWTVTDRDAILKQMLGPKSYLVKLLREGRGRAFARSSARYPDGYDRIDRMSRLPHGHTFLEGLISTADGYKMIEYMTEAPGGKVLGMQVEHAPAGKNFNEATGRIYTSEQLLTRLRASYDGKAHPATAAARSR